MSQVLDEFREILKLDGSEDLTRFLEYNGEELLRLALEGSVSLKDRVRGLSLEDLEGLALEVERVKKGLRSPQEEEADPSLKAFYKDVEAHPGLLEDLKPRIVALPVEAAVLLDYEFDYDPSSESFDLTVTEAVGGSTNTHRGQEIKALYQEGVEKALQTVFGLARKHGLEPNGAFASLTRRYL